MEQLAEKHFKLISEKSKNISDNIFVKCQTQTSKSDSLFQELKNISYISKISKSKFVQEVNKLLEEKVKYIKSKEENILVTKLVYELLTNIFQETTSEERPYIFGKLIRAYYQALSEKFKTFGNDIDTVLPLSIYNNEIRKLIPYVKLDVTCNFFDQKAPQVKCFVLELEEYFTYRGFLREDSYEIFNKLCEGSTKSKYLKYEFVPIEGRPGFLGEYFKLRVYIERDGKEDIIYCFVKFVSNNVPQILYYTAKRAFRKERFIYQSFVSKLEEFGAEDITDFAAKCYLMGENDFVVLDDLQVLGYKSKPPTLVPEFDWIALILKTIAKFHAGSLILEEKMSQRTGSEFRIGDHYIDNLEEVLFTTKNESGKVQECSLRMVLEFFLDKCPDAIRKISVAEFKDILKDTYQKLCVNFSASTKYRNVICHGDLWSSNIMFREENSKPVSCRLVDFQLTRYCPPILDISLFVYLITDKKTRDAYMTDLMEIYYKELSEHLSRHNVDINNIYDHQTFLNCFEELKVYGLWHAACYAQGLLCPPDVHGDSEDMDEFMTKDRSKMLEKAWTKSEQFRIRMTEYVQDLYDYYEKRNFSVD